MALIGFIIYLSVNQNTDCEKTKCTQCPTITYTGNDIENPTITELSCTDMIRGFGTELASLSGMSSNTELTCDDFQKILESSTVKSILQIDEIPEGYCSSDCCDISAYSETTIACVDSQDCSNMCINGINEEDGWRCDLGRKFEYVSDNTVKDSWTGGMYKGELYGDGTLADADNLCCTEQKKEGLSNELQLSSFIKLTTKPVTINVLNSRFTFFLN